MKDQDTKTKSAKPDELDMKKLRSHMKRGQSFLMDGLNSEIEFTVERMKKNRQIRSALEEELLDPEKLDKLSLADLVAFRKILDKNMRNDRQFLEKLLHSSPQITENLNFLEELREEKSYHEWYDEEKINERDREFWQILEKKIKNRQRADESTKDATPLSDKNR